MKRFVITSARIVATTGVALWVAVAATGAAQAQSPAAAPTHVIAGDDPWTRVAPQGDDPWTIVAPRGDDPWTTVTPQGDDPWT
ncbi:hypothetical protein [Streptomyces sp. A012304]|uniref:hypothetical protein n=1 Tax=Streptomyces sp. A012304 TaxID=375446 RepID=UPI002230075B|nr:hypothetical protein [Streptomyces sp. A012304]GKQ38433.1 hypothetical protein ALMP_49640 [Streptomyces sp. A012304]